MVRMADTLSLSNVKRIQKVLVIGIGILAQPERSGRNFKLYNYKNRNQDNKKETDYWPWIYTSHLVPFARIRKFEFSQIGKYSIPPE